MTFLSLHQSLRIAYPGLVITGALFAAATTTTVTSQDEKPDRLSLLFSEFKDPGTRRARPVHGTQLACANANEGQLETLEDQAPACVDPVTKGGSNDGN
jgi:hypothetical protein